MVRQERPGVDGEGAALRQGGEVGHEVSPVHMICEDDAALESPHHHMVELSGASKRACRGMVRGRVEESEQGSNAFLLGDTAVGQAARGI